MSGKVQAKQQRLTRAGALYTIVLTITDGIRLLHQHWQRHESHCVLLPVFPRLHCPG